VISFLPVHHAFGFEHALLAPLMVGARVDHHGDFTPEGAVDAVRRGVRSFPFPRRRSPGSSRRHTNLRGCAAWWLPAASWRHRCGPGGRHPGGFR
jgi:hypothetical protein